MTVLEFPAWRASRARSRPAMTMTWWQWFDFEDSLSAQVYVICLLQVLVLSVGGVILYATAGSTY